MDKTEQWARLKQERHDKRHSKPQKYGPNGKIALFRKALGNLVLMERAFKGPNENQSI